jgi:hypothetical protein
MEIRVLPAIRIPYIGPDVHMEATQVLAELPSGLVDACDCELLRTDVSTVSLTDFVWSGELRGFDEPVIAPHRITRIFGSPVTLLVDGVMRLQITSVSGHGGRTRAGYRGDHRRRPPAACMDGGQRSRSHARVVRQHRSHYVSDDEQPGRAHATDIVLGRSAEDDISTTD